MITGRRSTYKSCGSVQTNRASSGIQICLACRQERYISAKILDKERFRNAMAVGPQHRNRLLDGLNAVAYRTVTD